MPVQVATYLETGAHLYPEMEKINEVGLERLFVSAVVLQIPRGAGEKVTAPDIESKLKEAGETVNPGEALLIATGYNFLEDPGFKKTPHFRYDAVAWAVEHRCAILGSDMGSWQDPQEKPSFFPMFLKSGTLLLAPMVNVDKIPGGADQAYRDAAEGPRGLCFFQPGHRDRAGKGMTKTEEGCDEGRTDFRPSAQGV